MGAAAAQRYHTRVVALRELAQLRVARLQALHQGGRVSPRAAVQRFDVFFKRRVIPELDALRQEVEAVERTRREGGN